MSSVFLTPAAVGNPFLFTFITPCGESYLLGKFISPPHGAGGGHTERENENVVGVVLELVCRKPLNFVDFMQIDGKYFGSTSAAFNWPL